MLAVFLLVAKRYIVAPQIGVGYNFSASNAAILFVIVAPQSWVGYIPLKRV